MVKDGKREPQMQYTACCLANSLNLEELNHLLGDALNFRRTTPNAFLRPEVIEWAKAAYLPMENEYSSSGMVRSTQGNPSIGTDPG